MPGVFVPRAGSMRNCGMTRPCLCGCGSDAQGKVGYVKGHNKRGGTDLTRYSVEDRGYSTACWIWNGCFNPGGYGRVQVDGVHTVAHRVTFARAGGEIPDGFEVDHLCRQVACVNPAHLEAVNPEENRRRRHEAYTHCIRGHSLISGDVRVNWKGHRVCRTCERDLANARRAGATSDTSAIRKAA